MMFISQRFLYFTSFLFINLHKNINNIFFLIFKQI